MLGLLMLECGCKPHVESQIDVERLAATPDRGVEPSHIPKIIALRAYLLAQLVPCYLLQGLVARVVHAARGDLQAPVVHGVAILPEEHHLSLRRDRHHAYRAEALHVGIGNLALALYGNTVAPDTQPGRDYWIVRLQQAPAEFFTFGLALLHAVAQLAASH